MKHYTEQQIKDTLKIVDSSIVNCEKVQPKLKEGSASLSLNRNRIKALYIAKDLLENRETADTRDELEKAVLQIASIKSKSTTGIGNAKEGSAAYTRFGRLMEAMDVVLDYLQAAIAKSVSTSEKAAR